MNYYYKLDNGKVVESKWDKAVGERHLDSKVAEQITKDQHDAIVSQEIAEHNSRVRKMNRQADLNFAAMILEAGSNVGVDLKDTLTVMRDLAPNSLKALKNELSK